MKKPEAKRATDFDRAVCIRIRLRRSELGLSQQALADLVGVVLSQIVHYESGANRASGSRLARIAAALGAPVAYFLEQSAEDMEAASGALLRTPGVMALLRAYAAIKDRRQQATLVKLMWAVAEQERAREGDYVSCKPERT